MTLTKKQLHKALSEGGRKGGSAKVPKGFARMDKDKVKEAQSKGGRHATKSR